MKYIITIALSLLLLSCASGKTATNRNVDEETNIEVRDTSTIVSKVEMEKQFVSTDIKERIITLYSVRFDTIYVEDERIITPIVFPSQTEEFRDISTENYILKLKLQDSIKNAIEAKYNKKLLENEETIKELTNTRGSLRLMFCLIIICVVLWGALVFRYR